MSSDVVRMQLFDALAEALRPYFQVFGLFTRKLGYYWRDSTPSALHIRLPSPR